MILYIDTSQFNSVKFSLKDESKSRGRGGQKKITEKTFKIALGANHQTVTLLEKFLREKKITRESISKIVVSSGPGSFNGIRVGLSVAQALSLAWKIPVMINHHAAIQ